MDSRDSESGERQVLSEKILSALSDNRYGSVEIIIHDSKVVQIKRKEKIRFDPGQACKSK